MDLDGHKMWALLTRKPFLVRKVLARIDPISNFLDHKGVMHVCPFHQDENPSAKLHKDDDQERLFCFGCRKQYDSFDYVSRVMGREPLTYLRNTHSEQEIRTVLRLVLSEMDGKPREMSVSMKRVLEAKKKIDNLDECLVFLYLPEED